VSDTAIVVNDLHKRYDLGAINSGTFSNDLKILWAKLQGQKDPTQIIGEEKAGKEYWALKGLDFEIKKGESVGIIGKNGAGKSTLLKILSRVTAPTKGQVKIKGRIASLLEVGTGFHPDLTGRENIFMNGAILGMSRHEITSKLDEIIAFSGVEKYIDTPVKRYSSGMYVRLAFAVAAHLNSDILIIDEVLAVGDAEFQKKCLGRMGEASKEGRTVLFVSHNMGAVAELCNNCIVLSQGRIAYLGSVSKAISTYTQLNMDNSETPFTFIAKEESIFSKTYFIAKVSIVDNAGNPKGVYLFDECINIEVTLKSNVDNIDTVLSLILLNKNHQRVFTVHKELVSHKSEITMVAKLPSSLFAPNFYSFNISALVHNKVVYDNLENICPIQIVDNGSENALFEGIDYGNVIVKPQWLELVK
jgi:lipopolysaccharide transport system ATP-binding protein